MIKHFSMQPAATLSKMVSNSLLNVQRWLLTILHPLFLSGPEPAPQPRAVRSSTCQEHMNLHKRLDVVEKVLFLNQAHALSPK